MLPYQKPVGIAGAIAGLCLLSYAIGAASHPARVETKTVTVHDQVTITADGHATSDEASFAHDKTVEETHRPDGTVTVVKHDVETKVVVKTVVVEKIVEKEVKVLSHKWTLVEAAKPNWRLHAELGLTLSRDRLALPVPPPYSLVPLVVSAGIERRIVGPVYLGVWASTNKSAGISASVAF